MTCIISRQQLSNLLKRLKFDCGDVGKIEPILRNRKIEIIRRFRKWLEYLAVFNARLMTSNPLRGIWDWYFPNWVHWPVNRKRTIHWKLGSVSSSWHGSSSWTHAVRCSSSRFLRMDLKNVIPLNCYLQLTTLKCAHLPSILIITCQPINYCDFHIKETFWIPVSMNTVWWMNH